MEDLERLGEAQAGHVEVSCDVDESGSIFASDRRDGRVQVSDAPSLLSWLTVYGNNC